MDANIWAHAANPYEERTDAAQAFLQLFIDAKLLGIHVDQGFSLNEADNESRIGLEFLDLGLEGKFPYYVLQTLFSSGRCFETSRSVPQGDKGKIEQAVHDPNDRIYVFVAYNSDSRVLVSHDFNDFPNPVRRKIRKDVNVEIKEAVEILTALEE